jgi:LPXTG-motif cell wall-anchored protein
MASLIRIARQPVGTHHDVVVPGSLGDRQDPLAAALAMSGGALLLAAGAWGLRRRRAG